MFELPFTLEAVDRGDLFHQLLTFATIQKARYELEGTGVSAPLRTVKLDAAYAADLHRMQLLVPTTGEQVNALIDTVDFRDETGFKIGVFIHGTVSKLSSKGIDCSEFGPNIGKRRKVRLHYLFDWCDGSEPFEGTLTLDAIN